MKTVMIQDGVKVCPMCSGAVAQKVVNQQMYFYCVDCKRIFKVIDDGQSDRELKCEVHENV